MRNRTNTDIALSALAAIALTTVAAILLGARGTSGAQETLDRYAADAGRVRVGLLKMPYSGARNVAELSGGPDYLEAGGLHDLLATLGTSLRGTRTVALLPEQEDDYGEWHRLGMANGHLAELVADNERSGYLTVALESNCSSLLGVLAGLQRSGSDGEPLTVALVFIDAHGDFNTPETTLSGMLGGMPVAVAAGMCLTNLRHESGLEPPLDTSTIVMGAVRDTDPLEQELIESSKIEHITVEDMRAVSANVDRQMERLSELADLIYVHVDMDVLDPTEVPGHPLTVADGPTSVELGATIEAMFRHDKAAALGIASTPWGERDPDGRSRQAAYNLIEGAIRGVKQRDESR